MLIIPTYNEKENIEYLVKKIRAQMGDIPILFVDDNSPDGTADEIRRLQQTDKNILLRVRPGKGGLGSAYRDAFQHVMEKNLAKYVVAMDADLSHPPEVLPGLIAQLEDHHVVVGSRYIEGGGVANWNLKRRFLSRFANLYARLLTGVPVSDLTAGMVAYRVEALKRIDMSSMHTDGYAFQIEMKYLLHRSGASMTEHPITFRERRQGKSKLSVDILKEGVRFPLKIFLRDVIQAFRSWRFWCPFSVFLISFSAYASTMPATIYLGDSPEFVTAGATLGVAHPSGYPVYVMLSHLFSYLPFGTAALRVTLLSAVAASVSLVLLYLILKKIIVAVSTASVRYTITEKWAAFFSAASALIFAFSPIFWSQAIYAKMYTLNLLVILSLAWLVIRFWETGKGKYFLLGAFLFGAGLGVHEMLVLFLPVFAIGFFLSRHIVADRMFIKGALLAFLGFCVYLYLPIRSAMHPLLDWGATSSSLDAFVGHVLRMVYDDYGHAGNFYDKLNFLSDFFLNVTWQFGVLLVFAVAGLLALARKSWRMLFLTLGIFLSNSLGIIFMRSMQFTVGSAEAYSVYYIPAFAMAALWLGVGLAGCFAWLNALKAKKALWTGVVAGVALAGVVLSFGANFQSHNLRNFSFLDDYSKNLLSSIESNSVLLLSYEGSDGDSIVFSLLYQRAVAQVRPDIIIPAYPDIFKFKDVETLNNLYTGKDAPALRRAVVQYALANRDFAGRPIYTTFIADTGKPEDTWHSVPNGLVYRLVSSNQPNPSISEIPTPISENDRNILERDYTGRDVLAAYYYGQASLSVYKQNKIDSQRLFIQALQLDNDIEGADYKAYQLFRDKVLLK